MQQPPVVVKSREELHQLIPAIVETLNKNPRLCLAAGANPLLALEELGYQLDPSIRPAVERRLRFGARLAERLEHLAMEVYRVVNRAFRLDDPQELAQVLFEELKLPVPGESPQRVTQALPYHPPWGKAPADPLEVLRDAHPVLQPLLEYRRLEASVPRFASRELYERLRRGEARHPFQRWRCRLQPA